MGFLDFPVSYGFVAGRAEYLTYMVSIIVRALLNDLERVPVCWVSDIFLDKDHYVDF